MNYRRWLLVGYLVALMAFTFWVLSTAGTDYTILTTSDSGFFYSLYRDVVNTNSMPPVNNLSHAPMGLPATPGDYGQPLIAALIYKGVSAVNPSVTLLNVVRYYSPLFFALTLIPVFLIGRELGGDVAGCGAAFFMSTLTNSLYWSKIGAFDREITQIFFAAWTLFLAVKMFKARGRESLLKFSLLGGLVFGLFMFTWSGAMYIVAILLMALLFIVLNEGIPHWRAGPERVIWRGIRSSLPLILGVLGMLLVTTLVAVLFGGYSLDMWPSFFSTIFQFVGITRGIRYERVASEMQPVNYPAQIRAFYGVDILTMIVLLLVMLAIFKIIWTRGRTELLLLSWFLVLAAMPVAQARFSRPWWIMLPVVAGFGLAVVAKGVWWLLTSPRSSGFAWLDLFRHPLVVIICVLLLATPFLYNVRASATHEDPPPHGGTSPSVYYSLLEAYDWLRGNTPPDTIVAVEWSYGHLLAGWAERRTVVDGCDVSGFVGKWENSYVRPPDYIYRLADSEARKIGGRRDDIQELYDTPDDNRVKQIFREYRDNYGCKIDYVVFNLGRLRIALFSYRQEIQVLRSRTGYTLEFETENILIDPQFSTASTQDGKTLRGIVYAMVTAGGLLYPVNYSLMKNWDAQKVLWIFFWEDGTFAGAWLSSFIGDPMLVRIDQGLEMPAYLDEVFTSPHGMVKVYRVNHVPWVKSPADGAVVKQPTFEWSNALDGVRYELVVDNDPSFGSPEIHENNLTALTYGPVDNLAEGNYWWRVKAYDIENNSVGWSNIYSFAVDKTPPGAPVLRAPAHESETSDNTPTFRWSLSVDANNYRLIVDNDSDFSSPAENTLLGAAEDSYTLTKELPPDTYYWYVIAVDAVGNENSSPVWIFTVLPPGA